jgi:alpha-tubulin suppressor-like RCC1 family protein
VCGNGLDDDCDGLSDESPCAAPTPDAGTSDAGTLDTGTPDAGAIADDASLAGDPIVEVSGGEAFTCVRRARGTVLCWGDNSEGQLGDGCAAAEWRLGGAGFRCGAFPPASFVPARRVEPGPVGGLTDAQEISAGDTHVCARRSGGTVACWGRNFFPSPFGKEGMLGDGTSTHRAVPTPVVGLADAEQISAGSAHTCARRRGGAVVCWGTNVDGQLGDGTTTNRLVPTPVLGLADAVDLDAGGASTCAVRRDGGVVCWGRNSNGQLGDGTTEDRVAPTAVVGLTDAVQVSVGRGHACARRRAGGLVCWGRNFSGQLGDGTFDDRRAPTPVAGLAETAQVAARGAGTCALEREGRVLCWGHNNVGQVGDNTTSNRPTPTPLYDPFRALTDMVEIGMGTEHRCAISGDRALFCCGRNDQAGMLGDGTLLNRLSATPVVGL